MNRMWTLFTTGLAAAMMLPAAASAKCSIGQLVELKVTMLGRSPMVPVTLNGRTERFIVDSGAFYSSISGGKAQELALPTSALPDGFLISGIGGDVRPLLGKVKEVGLAGLKLKNVEFIVGGSEVESAAGLLGQNVLSIGDDEYDLGHGAVRVMRMTDCGKDAIPVYWSTTKPVSVVPLDLPDEINKQTSGTVIINGRKMRALFDTGADRTTLSLAAAARLGLKPGDPGVEPDGYGYGIGRKRLANFRIPIDSIKLGDNEEIRNTHLTAQAMDTDVDLLVGADFFMSHRVYVARGLRKLFFTYEGGPIFGGAAGKHVDTKGNAVATEADATAAPTDAEGLSRRGAAALSRRDYQAALADLDKAVAMAPDNPAFLVLRARAYVQSDQPHRAADDLDHALKLAPGDPDARIGHAELRFQQHDHAAAAADADALAASAAPAADARLALGGLFERLGRWRDAVGQYDLWLRYHRDDYRVPDADNGRCWARAQLGVDLDKALSDCDAALRARPKTASFLDSRGLVRLRMGDNVRALRDYDAALAIAPKTAWSLYGRGIVKRRMGDQKAGDADTAAALAINRHLAEDAQAIGLKD